MYQISHKNPSQIQKYFTAIEHVVQDLVSVEISVKKPKEIVDKIMKTNIITYFP